MMKRTVVYLSGPIEGVRDYWRAFEEADDALSSRGYVVFNPARLSDGMSKRAYMCIDLPALLASDVVLLLPGWGSSSGAQLERTLADYVGIPVYTSIGTIFSEVKSCPN